MLALFFRETLHFCIYYACVFPLKCSVLHKKRAGLNYQMSLTMVFLLNKASFLVNLCSKREKNIEMFWHSNKNAYLCKVKQEIGIMTTMTLQIDNPSIFEHLKSILGLMKGVTIVGMTDSLDVDIPNETTLSAMKEAESGEDAGIVNIDSVESFIASMR